MSLIVNGLPDGLPDRLPQVQGLPILVFLDLRLHLQNLKGVGDLVGLLLLLPPLLLFFPDVFHHYILVSVGIEVWQILFLLG